MEEREDQEQAEHQPAQPARVLNASCAGVSEDEECVEDDEDKVHHRDGHSLRRRVHVPEHIEPDDVARAHDEMSDERDRVSETWRVREKPDTDRNQHRKRMRLDHADHGRVLIERPAERTRARRVGLQVRDDAEQAGDHQEHGIATQDAATAGCHGAPSLSVVAGSEALD